MNADQTIWRRKEESTRSNLWRLPTPLPSWLSYQLGYPLIKKSLIKKCPRKDLKIATGTRDIFRWFEIVDDIKSTHKIEHRVVGLLLKVRQSNTKQQSPTDHSKWLIAPNFIPLRKITVRLSLCSVALHCHYRRTIYFVPFHKTLRDK